MRVRSSSYTYPKVVQAHIKHWGWTVNPNQDYWINDQYSDSETSWMEDVVTPHYRKLVASGQIINNPMHKITTFEKYTGGTYYQGLLQYSTNTPVTYNGYRNEGQYLSWLYNNGLRYLTPDSLDVLTLRDLAVTTAFARASANETELLASMGELNETISSLKSIFGRAVGIIMALKRLDLKRLAKEITPKELANRYMEARYAIRPLVYDVSNILNAFSNKSKSLRMTSRGGVTETAERHDVAVVYSHTLYDVYCARQVTYTVTAKAGVLTVIEHLTQLNVWGIDRIFTSAWELIPLSFVVDWFFNVGKIIASWQPTLGQKTLASWVTVDKTIIQSCSVDHCVPKWPTTQIHEKVVNMSGMCYKITTDKERTVGLTPPVYPHLDVRLDALKLLDLGLIIRSLYS